MEDVHERSPGTSWCYCTLGTNTFNVMNALTRSFPVYLPFSIIFKSSSRLSSWFQFKDVIPKISYVFGCYLQVHIRRVQPLLHWLDKEIDWKKRFEEIGVDWEETWVICKCSFQHHEVWFLFQGCKAGEEFTMIGREKNPYGLRLNIFICSQKPNLNGSMTSVPMSLPMSLTPFSELCFIEFLLFL